MLYALQWKALLVVEALPQQWQRLQEELGGLQEELGGLRCQWPLGRCLQVQLLRGHLVPTLLQQLRRREVTSSTVAESFACGKRPCGRSPLEPLPTCTERCLCAVGLGGCM